MEGKLEQIPSHIARIVIEAYSIAKNTRLWPGWDPVETLLVFHSPQVAYVIGNPDPPAGYGPAGTVGSHPVYAGLPLPEMFGNTALEINGRWHALVLIPGPDARVEDYARLVLHECFHVYQQTALQHIPKPNMLAMSRYPANDPENNALCIVENRLLARALEGDRQAILHFLIVRRGRHERLRSLGLDDVIVYEELSEYNEGTARYIEAKAGAPLQTIEDGLLKSNIGGDGAGYRRFYFTGAAISLLLDRVLPGWQTRFEKEGKPLRLVMEEAVKESYPVSAAPDFDEILQECGHRSVLDAELSRERERRGKIAAIMENLKSGPGVLVEIEIPPDARITFDPINLLVPEPGVRIHNTRCGAKTAGGAEVIIEGICLEEQEPHRFTIRLPGPPEVSEQDGFSVSAPGLKVRAPAGSMKRAGSGSHVIKLQSGPLGQGSTCMTDANN